MTPIAAVDIAAAASWIKAIPFKDWPQQHRLSDGGIRPAMMTDLAWHGFGEVTASIVAEVARHFPGATPFQRMLSAVMPGHEIEPHRDLQADYWICRVHVPLISNERAMFIVDGEPYHLRPRFAYQIDTLAEHGVRNEGNTPRVHLMWDMGHA